MDNQLPQVELISSGAQVSAAPFPFSETLDSGIFVNATNIIAGIEINTIDIALLVLCPLFTALGVLVASLVNSNDQYSQLNAIKRFFNGVFSNLANLLAGVVLGIVIALFFIGAINNDISSLAGILVLSIFLGYKAPLLWNFHNRNAQQIGERPVNIANSTNTAAKAKPAVAVKTKPAPVSPASAPSVSLNQDALKQEKLKKARLKLAAKS